MKKYLLSIVLSTIGLSCFVLFTLKGSRVMDDGRLVESFGFIPLGFLFLVLGLVSAGLIAIVGKIRQAR